MSGAAIEFDGSTDPRAAMLEKQVVMSMYMARSQEAGSLPPQETGLLPSEKRCDGNEGGYTVSYRLRKGVCVCV